MPTRSLERSFGGALGSGAEEGFFANHVGNVGKRITGPFHVGLNYFHFTDVFDEAFRAGVIDDDALPTFAERNFAPLAAFAAEEFNVDKAALAVDRAPVADGFGGGDRFVGELFDLVETAEARAAAGGLPIERDESRADRACFAGIRVDDDVGVGNFGFDEIHLGFYDGEIFVRAALEDEFVSGAAQVAHAACVNPNVERKNGAERGENFVGLPAFALLVDDVRLQEDAAAHGKLRHGFGVEGAVGHLAHRDVEAFGDALEERAVARGTLRVEAEVSDGAIGEQHDFHVNAADVADAIGVRKKVEAGAGVSDGFNDGAIGAENTFEEILAVAGDAEADDFADADRFADLAKERFGVFDRVALAERVAGEEQFLFGREADGFGGGGAEVAAD